MTILNAGRIGLRQAEPPEGRFGFPLGSAYGGGDGINFATGAEIFTFNSANIQGAISPSGILSMWVDASVLTAGKNLTIITPTQTFVVAGGSQGYLIVTSQIPFTLNITTNAGTGLVKMILYNYNVFFTGNFATAAAYGGGTGGGSGGGGGGGLGGGTGGGGKLTL